MAAVCRIGDMSTGHVDGNCYFPPKPAVEGSSNVFVNGIAVVGVGDRWDIHCCGVSCHDSVSSEGSPTVFVNGVAIARVGDQISCHTDELVAQGSANVFVN